MPKTIKIIAKNNKTNNHFTDKIKVLKFSSMPLKAGRICKPKN